MLVMALNSGSATLKCQIYDTDKAEVIAFSTAEAIGTPDSMITQKYNDERNEFPGVLANHANALVAIKEHLSDAGLDMSGINAVGHRVVQGGEKYKSSVLIDGEVISTIEGLSVLAPLHNPANLMGIRAAREMLPNAVQVAVFDTAFHQTMPEVTYRYSVPDSWYRDLGVRKYGFHGTSHLYVSKRAAKMLGKSARDTNLVTLHIGSGASACAIKNGVSYDTSMGMTPLAGMSMGTRTGDIDPGVILYVMERLGLSPSEMNSVLGKQSGHIGLCGVADRRDLVANYDSKNLCKLALDIEALNVKRYIGAYLAEIGPIDAIVFTAGVGENNSFLRGKMMDGLEHLGIKIDQAKNQSLKGGRPHIGVEEAVISTSDSKIAVMVIPTNEELVIIEDTIAILSGTYNPNHLEMEYSFV